MKAKCGLALLAVCFAVQSITPGSAYPRALPWQLNDRTSILEALISKLQQEDSPGGRDEEEMEIQGPEPKAYETDEMNEMDAYEMEDEGESEYDGGDVVEQLYNTNLEGRMQAASAEKSYCKAIFNGNTIALQTSAKYRWITCYQSPCKTTTCPSILMDGNDFERCWGAVFQIYREGGDNEPVRVGDRIGIYNPHEDKWLGCSGKCDLRSCPGKPSIQHGFEDPNRWKICVQEVFQIYARGKEVGSVVEHDDIIRIYFPFKQSWLSSYNNNMQLVECPGKPVPTDSSYNNCIWSVFTVAKKGVEETD